MLMSSEADCVAKDDYSIAIGSGAVADKPYELVIAAGGFEFVRVVMTPEERAVVVGLLARSTRGA
jgi:hypothetical protein